MSGLLKSTVYQYGFAPLPSYNAFYKGQYLTNSTLHLIFSSSTATSISTHLSAPHCNNASCKLFSTPLYLPSPCSSNTVHWWRTRVSSLLLLFRNSFTEKTFQDSQITPCQSAKSSLVARRCIYFCRRHLLWNSSLRWLAIFGNQPGMHVLLCSLCRG